MLSPAFLLTVGPPRLIRTTLASFADWRLGYSVIGGKLARGRRIEHLSRGLEPRAQPIYQPRIKCFGTSQPAHIAAHRVKSSAMLNSYASVLVL